MLNRSPASMTYRICTLTCLISGLMLSVGSAAGQQPQSKPTTSNKQSDAQKTAAKTGASKRDTAEKDTNAKDAAKNSDQAADATQKSAAKTADTSKTTKTEPVVKKKAPRIVSFSGGRTRLNVRHWPLIGNPDARYVFVEMFDYTCPHCRNTHRALEGAFDRLKDDLAVIVLPVPLDARCNSAVRSTGAQHREACAVATIAVAVWRCNPSSFHEFHDWMFAVNRSRTAREARAHGEKMVGKAKLDAELARPYAKQYIKKHVELYRRAGAGTLPKMMFPRTTLAGAITSPTTMVRTIQRHLGN